MMETLDIVSGLQEAWEWMVEVQFYRSKDTIYWDEASYNYHRKTLEALALIKQQILDLKLEEQLKRLVDSPSPLISTPCNVKVLSQLLSVMKVIDESYPFFMTLQDVALLRATSIVNKNLDYSVAKIKAMDSKVAAKPKTEENTPKKKKKTFPGFRLLTQCWRKEIRRIKNEKDHLENVLQILYTKVLDSKEKAPDKDKNAFTLPNEMDKESKIATLYQHAEDMSNKFQELNGDVELASKLFAELSSLSSASDTNHREEGEVQSNDQSTQGENNENLGRRNDGATTPSGSEVAQNLQRNFEVVKTTLIQMKDAQHDIEDVSSRLEELGQSMEGADDNSDHNRNTESSDKSSTRTTVNESKTHPPSKKFSVSERVNKVEKIIRRQVDEIEKLKSDLKEAETILQTSQAAERKRLEEEVESLRTRLSELAGAKLIKDNPAITDLSDPNRPTKLGEYYCQLYDNEWTDVFQTNSENKKKLSEENVIKNLLNILLEGFEYCKRIKDLQNEGLEGIIFFPARDKSQKLVPDAKVKSNEVFARHLTEAVKLCGEMTGEDVAKVFIQNKDRKKKIGIVERNEKYVTKCVKLCWLMLIQTPPVCIDLSAKPGDQFDKDTYKEYTKKGKKIDFIVWPPLRLHTDGPLLAKGVAQGK